MAVETAPGVDDRPVEPRLVEGVGHLIVMTPLAEFESGIPEPERRGGGRRLVTLVAFPLADWLVDVVEEDAVGAGTVWVVARGATSPLDRVVVVHASKSGVVGLVAVQAECRLAVFEQARVGR